jgi:bacteriocin-like protein
MMFFLEKNGSMSNISILNLHSIDTALLSDPESFIDELTDKELNRIEGGYMRSPILVSSMTANNSADSFYVDDSGVLRRT